MPAEAKPTKSRTAYVNKTLAYIDRERERNKVLNKTIQNLNRNGARFNANERMVLSISK